MSRKNKFYIAAPFFNQPQTELVHSIEETFVGAGIDFFSPRLLDENKEGPLTPQIAAAIFRKDIHGITVCDSMLAVVDWNLPEGQLVELRDYNGIDPGKPCDPARGRIAKLNIPDSGTVFEMGMAYMRMHLSQLYGKTASFDPVAVCENAAARLPGGPERTDLSELGSLLSILQKQLSPIRTVVFTDRPPHAGLNLMLTQGAAGVVNGMAGLKAFLGKTGDPDWDSLKPWVGKNR